MSGSVSIERPWGRGRIVHVLDRALNDSAKNWTVPEGKVWDLLNIVAELQNSATVANRFLHCFITNGTNWIWASIVVGATTASQKATLNICFGSGELYHATTRAGILTELYGSLNAGVNLGGPRMLLPAGYVIQVWDAGAGDAAADDLAVHLEYIEYDV